MDQRGTVEEGGILDGLNPEQLEAVTTTEGYVAVIAGAGSGKTKALTRRFAYLVNEIGIKPGNILCVTFTNKAAAEMRERIKALTGSRVPGYINTFHGFCVSVLQEDSHAANYPKNFMVLDNSDIDDMLGMIYEERGLTLRDRTFSQARDMFEMRKCISERDYIRLLMDLSKEELKKKYEDAEKTDDILFYGYLYLEKKCFGLDYNDLIIMTLEIFRNFPDIRLKWQKRLEYIMIDEFQDIDPLQYELMEALCGYYGNLFVVGDPDQTIYTWRGARIRYISEFAESHKDTRVIYMLKNYRSTPEILSTANSLIAKNRKRIPKNLEAVLPHGLPVRYHHSRSQEQEAQFLASEISSLNEKGVPYSDIAILYRAHYVSRWIEEVFIREKVPYRIYSGVQFFSRAEIKDATSYLRMIAFQDDLSFRRIINVPKRNIGRRRMAFLEKYASEHGCTLYEALSMNQDEPLFSGTGASPFINMIESYRRTAPEMSISKVLEGILNDSGYELMLRTEGSQDRLDNLAELKQSVLEYEMTCGEETDLTSYLDQLAMFTTSDADDRADRVKMMTVHAAKGLEFPYVFLAGMEEGVFPSRKIESVQEMEEERRLCFVAVTRAEKGLILTDSEGKNFNSTWRYPSRFIFDIDRDCISWDSELPASLVRAAGEYAARTDLRLDGGEGPGFSAGDRVAHPVFGRGTILEIDLREDRVSVRFDDLDRERVFSSGVLTKLRKLDS
ncbi:MAG: ATP-dependent helicase [Oscillospiraceae bacterium]|jgi:DNA helicase-2/ATP-dependent DNA helicase PcrA